MFCGNLTRISFELSGSPKLTAVNSLCAQAAVPRFSLARPILETLNTSKEKAPAPLDERHANDMTLANRVYDLDLAIGDPVAWFSCDGRQITDEGTVLYVEPILPTHPLGRKRRSGLFSGLHGPQSNQTNSIATKTLATLSGSDQDYGTQLLTRWKGGRS